MKIYSILFISLITLAFLPGCKRNSDNAAEPPALTGGKGGASVIVVTPEHHGSLVDSCTIYIKYATDEAPPGVYDDSVVCTLVDTLPIAVFTGMKAGSYYLYGVGFHAGYSPPYVKGGLPCTLDKDTAVVYLPTYSYNR